LKAIPQNGAMLSEQEEHAELLNCLFDCQLKRLKVAKVIENVKGEGVAACVNLHRWCDKAGGNAPQGLVYGCHFISKQAEVLWLIHAGYLQH
jgi:hypothetical protein